MALYAHYEAAAFYDRIDRWYLGASSVSLAFAATIASVGVAVAISPPQGARISVAVLAGATAALAALQRQLGPATLAERHRVSGARYGAARRHAEELQLLVLQTADEVAPKDLREQVAELIKELDSVAGDAPIPPRRLIRRADSRAREWAERDGRSTG